MRRIVGFLLLVSYLITSGGALGEATLHGWAYARHYEYVSFGRYPQMADGTVLPVLWRVLNCENNQALILSEYVLDAQQVIFVSDPQVIKKHTYRRISNFAESDLHNWLNDVMVDNLFTQQEQDAVISSSRGQVFILTRAEYLTRNYGFSSGYQGEHKSRKCKPTEYAVAQGAYKDRNGATSYWANFIRHPERYLLQLVGYNGHLSWGSYARKNVGLRVACLLDLNRVNIISGTGTVDDPFVILPTQTP